jgi:hypothetical protein
MRVYESKSISNDIKKVEREIDKLKMERKRKYAGEYARKLNRETNPQKKEELIKPVREITKKINDLQKQLSVLQQKELDYIDKVAKTGYDQELYIDEGKDVEIGHTDDEPEMIKDTVYQMAEYSIKLYKMVDYLEKKYPEVDFPHWWQAKIVKAREYVGTTAHYLESKVRNEH